MKREDVLANGIKHHLRTIGNASSSMVLLHGWPQTSYCWRYLLDALADSFHMVAPDLRGIGDTAKPDTQYDKATVAADIWAIMDKRGINKTILVGHDIGARVAIRMTLDQPDRIDRLIIINGRYPVLGDLKTSDLTQMKERWYFFFHQYPDLVEKLVSENIRAYYSHFLNHWSHPSFFFKEEDVNEYVRAYSTPGSIRGGCAHYQAAMNEDVAQWAADVGKTISVPTLVIWGSNDPCSPPFYTDGYDQVFINSSLHFISECGHFPHEEKPSETIALIREFCSVNPY